MKNKYMEENPLKWAIYHKNWCLNNPDKVKIYQGKSKEYYKLWVLNNSDKIRELQANWYQKNKEKVIKTTKNYYENNKEKIKERRKKYLANNKEKLFAQSRIWNLRRSGKLKLLPCNMCGELKTSAHHEDYSKPYEIVWLCKLHHARADSLRRLREKTHNK